MRTSNRFYFDQKYHEMMIDSMSTMEEQQADAVTEESERVQRNAKTIKTILRKAV